MPLEEESDGERGGQNAPKRAARQPVAKPKAAAGRSKLHNPDGSSCRRRTVEKYNQKTYGQVAVTRLHLNLKVAYILSGTVRNAIFTDRTVPNQSPNDYIGFMSLDFTFFKTDLIQVVRLFDEIRCVMLRISQYTSQSWCDGLRHTTS